MEAFTFFIIPPLATELWMQRQTGVSLKLIRQCVDLTRIKLTDSEKRALPKRAGARDATNLTLEPQNCLLCFEPGHKNQVFLWKIKYSYLQI